MATSGVTTNQLTRNQYIEAALRKLNVIAEGQTPSTESYTNGTFAFNALIGEFRTLGMPLWARTTHSFSPVASTVAYNIGSGQTLNTPYPVKMLQAYRQDSGQTTKTPVELISDYNFNMLPSSSGGMPIQLTYQPKVNLGVIKLWPTPDATAATSTITLIYFRPIEYVSASTDTIDFPEEWTNAVIYNLAARLAPEWGVPLPDRRELSKEADKYLERALENSNEDASFFFQPERRW